MGIGISVEIPEILATLSCGLFAGAALYISLVEQPARLSCGIELAIREWRPSYQRGAVMQPLLALTGSVLAFLSAWLSRDPAWNVGGALLFAVVPFTRLAIYPTNQKLQSAYLDLTSRESESLLRLWGQLHALRTLLSLLAFAILLYALTSNRA